MQTYKGNTPIKGNLGCKVCNSSDAVTLYENPDNKSRFYKCFSCGKAYKVKGAELMMQKEEAEESDTPREVSNADWSSLPHRFRGISKDTFDFYKMKVNKDGFVKFEYTDYKGNLLAEKIRFLDKKFTIKHQITNGFQQSGLFGCSLFPSGGKYLTVTEGEYDAAACYELMGSKYPVVSLKNGANSQLTQEDKHYLDSFDNIVYCGDNDPPGRKAAEKFAGNFAKNKVKIVYLSQGKDANEYLERISKMPKDDAEELSRFFIKEWWNAAPYAPEGLIQGKGTYSLLMQEKEAVSIPFPWEGLQSILHGIRTSELVVITAGSGVGKTAVIRELAYHIFKNTPDAKIGCMFLEEALKRTVKDFVGIELGVNLRLPENVVDSEKRKEAWNAVFDNDRWIFWDHFGSNDVETVCNQVRFIANNFGAKYIFLDHISIIVSDGSSGDERKTLDAIMTRLRTLVQELDISLFLVSHLRRSNDSVSHEEGGVTSLSQLRGSAGIGQLADTVIGLERNGQAESQVERNLTTLRILKNRFTGETGPACYLLWDKTTGRLKEINNPSELAKMVEQEKNTAYNNQLPAVDA